MKLSRNSRYSLALLSIMLIMIFGLTGCDGPFGGETPIEKATLTGNPVRYSETSEEYFDTYALLVLEQNGEEVKRDFIDLDQSVFEFDKLEEGNYTLKVYFTAENMIEKNVVIDDTSVSLGQIEIEPEEIPAEEMNGTFVLAFDSNQEYVNNENIRLAMAHAIDREEIMNIFVNKIHLPDNGITYETKIANRLSSPVVNGYDENQEINFAYNIEKANNYMDNVDSNEEITLDFYHFDDGIYADVADSIKASLENVDGLSIKPIPVEGSEIFDDQKSFYPIVSIFTKSPLSGSKIDLSDELEELRNQAGMNIDNPKIFEEKILEYEKLIIEEARIIPVFYRASYQEE